MSNSLEGEPSSIILASSLASSLAASLMIDLFDSGAVAPVLRVELDDTAAPRPDLSQSAFDSNCGACGSDSDIIVTPRAFEVTS